MDSPKQLTSKPFKMGLMGLANHQPAAFRCPPLVQSAKAGVETLGGAMKRTGSGQEVLNSSKELFLVVSVPRNLELVM